MTTGITPPPRSFDVQRSNTRYFADHGWLKTYHSFSFADYYDPENLHWGALRVFNDDFIAPGAGFPMHSHRDMEILTYVLSGRLEHNDSLGNQGVVKDGGVQFMSAGTGVRHSEYNASKEEELHLVQMWVLPKEMGTEPTYGQVDFDPELRRNQWLVVATGEPNIEAPIGITQDATLRVCRLEDTHLRHTFQPKRYGFLFLADGEVDANGETLKRGDGVRLYAVERLEIKGTGELVLWDLPEVER
jgi:redox-sensitive bicupin YhaK (pirin superfamily)